MAVAGGEEPEAFVARFDGDDHEVADYLLTEVMDGLPAATRRFMLRTSICTDLRVGLAERLSDRMDAARVLDRLEQRNAFTRRVGRDRAMYRYHDLLRTFLLAELRRDDPRVERELQHTAARWYQQQGDHLHAMEHLAAAGDGEQVIDLARSHGLAAILSGRSRRLYHILLELPGRRSAGPGRGAAPHRRRPRARRHARGRPLARTPRPRCPRPQHDPALAVLAAAVGHGSCPVRPRRPCRARAAGGRTRRGDRRPRPRPLRAAAAGRRTAARRRLPGAVSDLERATVLARAGGRDAMLCRALSFLAGARSRAWGTFRPRSSTPPRRSPWPSVEAGADLQSLAHAYMLLGWMASLRGDTETAELAAARALASLAQHNEPDIELAARSLELYLIADHHDAFNALRRYLQLFERLADADVSPALFGYAAPVSCRSASTSASGTRPERIAELAIRRAPDPGEPALLRAMLHVDAGQPAAARRDLDPCSTVTVPCHLVTTEVRAWLLGTTIEQEAGNLTRAQERLGVALRWPSRWTCSSPSPSPGGSRTC
jgi:LuxR family transcriptional regulator, maltose regulon positive regulatory protein